MVAINASRQQICVKPRMVKAFGDLSPPILNGIVREEQDPRRMRGQE